MENELIKLSGNSIVYVLCPAYFKTGGTELLHQYVSVLNKSSINAKIVYPDATVEKNINPAFECYVKEYSKLNDVVDSCENIFVMPEIMTGYVKKFKNLKKVIWWESVDNYLVNKSISFNLSHMIYGFKGQMKNIIKIILKKNKQVNYRTLKKVDYHFVQSEYARDFLKEKNIVNNVFSVSDYINDVYLVDDCEIDFNAKENIVCYNPKKGKKYTNKIIKYNPEVCFVPLVNMTNQEVKDTLKKSKLYIDFGNHPGKDRFPREAAMMGCCIITNKRGSARFKEDVYIDDKYKFNDNKRNLKNISLMIKEILNDYQKCINDYRDYRERIKEEKNKFEEECVKVFNIEK